LLFIFGIAGMGSVVARRGSVGGQWIGRVHARRPPRGVAPDMDASVSPTRGERETRVWNGRYEGACCHPLFVFNQFGDLERGAPRGRRRRRRRIRANAGLSP